MQIPDHEDVRRALVKGRTIQSLGCAYPDLSEVMQLLRDDPRHLIWYRRVHQVEIFEALIVRAEHEGKSLTEVSEDTRAQWAAEQLISLVMHDHFVNSDK